LDFYCIIKKIEGVDKKYFVMINQFPDVKNTLVGLHDDQVYFLDARLVYAGRQLKKRLPL